VGLDLIWRFMPAARSDKGAMSEAGNKSAQDELILLRSLIQRFPFWQRGRAILAERSLAVNDVATAYAEAQALRSLSRGSSLLHATSLSLLGQCYLKRGDGNAALPLLKQASDLRPQDFRIREEQAAAHVLVGERSDALEILQRIPAAYLSAEGKAALQWLSSKPS
jgi:tetratricopeptide (TPR) repeat protein